MLFSLRRKAPKDSPRRCLGLSFIYWKVYTHGSQQLFALASLGKPTFAVREVCATGKLASAGARLSERTRCPFGVFRRGLRTLCGTQTGSRRDILSDCTNGQAGGLRLLFVLFLSAQEKNMFLSFEKGERKTAGTHLQCSCRFIFTIVSITDKGKQRNVTRSFDRFRQLSLMLRASACHSAGQNLRALRNELAQSCDILIIDLLDLFRAEYADFLSSAISAVRASRSLFSIHCDETSYSVIL